MDHPLLYRKRIIPEECVLLKDDEILLWDDSHIVTRWRALKPRKDLHHGFSCYFLKEGCKISKFYGHDNTLLYFYCDIIAPHIDEEQNALIVTDLLADVICYPDGNFRVVDLAELATAHRSGALSDELLDEAILSLDALLQQISDRTFLEKIRFLEQFE